ncbi:MAG: hypothetical protein WBV61_05675 [Rhodanobacteraceae bacterium]
MKTRTGFRSASLVLLALLGTACTSSATSPEKTEVLPADGGDLGKAYTDLVAAFKAGDKARAAKLLDPAAWHLDDKQASWFAQFASRMDGSHPVGGRRQGNRATLFVVDSQPYYAMMNATHSADGWMFDSPLATGSSFSEQPRDCKTDPKRFPCSAASAPDAQVSGHVLSHEADPLDQAPALPVTIFDGVAVRMLDAQTKHLKFTRLLLSAKGINPKMLALSHNVDIVKGWLNYPILALDVAPDGKTAKLEYYNGFARKTLDVADGLSIDANTPGRMRGRLQTDVSAVANFDVSFDMSTMSECDEGAYTCGG